MNKKIINKYITAQSSGKTGEISIWGDISSNDWWDDSVTPKDIKQALDDMGNVDKINISINSYGGECDAGILIYNVLDDYRNRNNIQLNVSIDGVAASMGGVIAMVGDNVQMRDNSIIMLHKPSGLTWGNADEMRKQAEILDKYEQRLINIFMKKFNGTEDELKQILADETWYLADEAKEKGLCDEIITSIPVAASANGVKINGIEFNKDLMNKIKDKVKIAESTVKNKNSQESEENKKVLIYDAKLTDFGITEEQFNAFENVNDFIAKVVDKAREGYIANEDVPEPVAPYITSEMVKDKLGKEVTADELLNMANKATELEGIKNKFDDITNKFESIRQETIENAITNGIRANEKFDETKWKNRLNAMTYDEIKDISNEWLENAKESLKAGVRVTKATDTNKLTVGKENYNF